MALNWDTSKIKEELSWFKVSKEQLKKEQAEKLANPNRISLFGHTREKRKGEVYQMKTEVQLLIWLSMNVGMNEITEKNYKKFFNRLDICQKLTGGGFLVETTRDDKGQETSKTKLYTLDMVKECIGLKTNANTLTANQFTKQVLSQYDI